MMEKTAKMLDLLPTSIDLIQFNSTEFTMQE